jgi:membrane associated rhomboid family serine protease
MFRSPPPLTRSLIAINVIAFAIEALLGTRWFADFMLWPLGPDFAPWQILSYGFLHGSLTHLLFNMLALYMFGSDLEGIWGQRRYLIYYLSCIVAAAIAQLIVTSMMGSQHPTVGAPEGLRAVARLWHAVSPHRRVAHSADSDAGLVVRHPVRID